MRGLMLFLALGLGALGGLAACRGSSEGQQLTAAKLLIASNCGACHLIPGIAGARGRVGPSLAGIARQQIIAGHFINSPASLTDWIEHPQQLLPGDAMPEMGLSHEQAQIIATYLYTLD
jgi:cytochrome c